MERSTMHDTKKTVPLLLVIADDLTGALDTGVQFCKREICTQVSFAKDLDWDSLPADLQVLIVDAETRHLPAAEAYRMVHGFAEDAFSRGVKMIYKKVDSGLRGNVGTELHALADATEGPVYFIAAFPKTRRTTRLGIHYIDGVPVSDSVFGKDPFEPVRFSSIPQLIAQQSDIPVTLCSPEDLTHMKHKAIVVVDGETDNDLKMTAQALQPKPPRAMAGCAGFAAFLPDLLQFKKKAGTPPKGSKKMIVISGSVNPITLQQGRFARDNGFSVFELTPEQKLSPGYFAGAKSQLFYREIQQASMNDPILVTVAMTDEAVESTDDIISGQRLSREDARVIISQNIGELAAKLLLEEDATLFIVGGDTLHATLDSLGVYVIEPLQELVPGVVLSRIETGGQIVEFATKSGGFGGEDTILQAGNILRSYL